MAAAIKAPSSRKRVRWAECERAIKRRFDKIEYADMRTSEIKELINDAVDVGWSEAEVRRAIWTLNMLRDGASVTRG